MKDGLKSAQVWASNVSGTSIYSSNEYVDTNMTATGSVIAGCSLCTTHSGTSVKMAGSIWAVGAGSFAGTVTAGSFTSAA
jgi:hypothetical protein